MQRLFEHVFLHCSPCFLLSRVFPEAEDEGCGLLLARCSTRCLISCYLRLDLDYLCILLCSYLLCPPPSSPFPSVNLSLFLVFSPTLSLSHGQSPVKREQEGGAATRLFLGQVPISNNRHKKPKKSKIVPSDRKKVACFRN